MFVLFTFSFPELEFFKCLNLREKMITVLFCYAKYNQKLMYKQVRDIQGSHFTWKNGHFAITFSGLVKPGIQRKYYKKSRVLIKKNIGKS